MNIGVWTISCAVRKFNIDYVLMFSCTLQCTAHGIYCCDRSRRVSFHLLLYLKSRLDTGVRVDRYSLDVLLMQETDNN
jgi:hypothetical protein